MKDLKNKIENNISKIIGSKAKVSNDGKIDVIIDKSLDEIINYVYERTVNAILTLIHVHSFYESMNIFLQKIDQLDVNKVDMSKIIRACHVGNTQTNPLCSIHFTAFLCPDKSVIIDCRGCPACNKTETPGCYDIYAEPYKYFFEKDFLGFFDNTKTIKIDVINSEIKNIIINSQKIAECYKIVLDEIQLWDRKRFLKAEWSFFDFRKVIEHTRKELL